MSEEALRRRLSYHVSWAADARAYAKLMLSQNAAERLEGERWWRETLDQPRVVLSA